MQHLEQVLSVIDRVNERVGRIVSCLVLFMMVSIVYEVVARYFFNSPTIWVMELNEYVLCAYTALAGGYTFLYGAHVNVDIVYQRFGVRTKALVDILTFFFFFLFIVILIWKSWGMAAEAWRFDEHSESLLAAPLFPSKVVIPVGGCLILLQGVAKLLRDIRTLITGVREQGREGGIFAREKGEEE
jgi:TRAP-type mannitol/chloroaromatic compound transport system permease small subunit